MAAAALQRRRGVSAVNEGDVWASWLGQRDEMRELGRAARRISCPRAKAIAKQVEVRGARRAVGLRVVARRVAVGSRDREAPLAAGGSGGCFVVVAAADHKVEPSQVFYPRRPLGARRWLAK
jgi:hypothetical protein